MRRAGLRTRVTAGFAAVALTLSAAMALVSYQLTRDMLIEQRERTLALAATSDAAVVRTGLDGDQPDIARALRALDTGENQQAVLHRDGTWYAIDAGAATAIPKTLQDFSQPGRSGMRRIHTDGLPALVVAIPLSASTTFYEIGSLTELESTLYLLALSLTVAAIMTGAAGRRWAGTPPATPCDRSRRSPTPPNPSPPAATAPDSTPPPNPTSNGSPPPSTRWSTNCRNACNTTGASPPTSATNCAHPCRPCPQPPAS